MSAPLVTPYDVFQAYRDQNERVAAKLVEVPVEKFLGKVPEPTAGGHCRPCTKNTKTFCPTPLATRPGSKFLARFRSRSSRSTATPWPGTSKDKLTEAELRAAYASRKSEFQERSELPNDLFAGQPELTPPIIRPFEDVRNQLAVALAEEKAQTEIADKFSKIKDEVLIPFYEEYAAAQEEIEEAKKLGTKSKKELPRPDRPQRARPARTPEL